MLTRGIGTGVDRVALRASRGHLPTSCLSPTHTAGSSNVTANQNLVHVHRWRRLRCRASPPCAEPAEIRYRTQVLQSHNIQTPEPRKDQYRPTNATPLVPPAAHHTQYKMCFWPVERFLPVKVRWTSTARIRTIRVRRMLYSANVRDGSVGKQGKGQQRDPSQQMAARLEAYCGRQRGW